MLTGLAALPPFVSTAFADALMAAFDPVCHQLFDRSPHVHGTAFAVCHRCFGAYIGFTLGAFLFTATRGRSMASWHPMLILVAAAVPGVIDWGGDIVGIWTNTPISRLITGGWFGIMAGMLLASSVLEKRRSA